MSRLHRVVADEYLVEVYEKDYSMSAKFNFNKKRHVNLLLSHANILIADESSCQSTV